MTITPEQRESWAAIETLQEIQHHLDLEREVLHLDWQPAHSRPRLAELQARRLRLVKALDVLQDHEPIADAIEGESCGQ